MSKLFISMLNMSLMASYIILFVMLIRIPLKKAPKAISYALWSVVAFRLIIPFSLESIFSLIPRNMNANPIPQDIIYQQSPQINSGIKIVDSFINQSLSAPIIGASTNPLQIYAEIGAYIWILGMIILFIYSVTSILLLKKQLKSAELIENNIFKAGNLKTPFVLGLIRPKIYLPEGINYEERSYILLHEQTHIHRKDHIIKIFAFLILSIHWFNPLVWIAFILMSRDMELSCDERVLKEKNENIKKAYASSLLSLASGRHILHASPLAFGEGNVKGRIKNVMNYKKPKFWVILIAMILAIVVSIGLIVNPINDTKLSDASDIYQVSEKWAEALKNRDGKIRYDLMAPESKADYYNSLVEINGEVEYPWVIGWSSPYVESYDIEISRESAVITYITKTQSESEEYVYQEQLFFTNIEGKNYVSKYYEFDISKSNIEPTINIGDSIKFTKEEIGEAIELVKNDFDFPASTLTKIWYKEEESDKFSKLYLDDGRGSGNGAESENVIVLLSNFDVDDSGEDSSLNPNSTYENFQWILIRSDDNSD